MRVLRERLGTGVLVLLLSLLAVLVLVPLVYATTASFKPLNEILSAGAKLWPATWTWDNYAKVFAVSNFGRYLLNSVIVTVGVVALDLVISPLLGYLLARKLLPGGKVVSALLGFAIFIGVGTVTIYPRYEIASLLGIDNLIGVIVVELATLTPVHTFLVVAFISSLPPELEDAARMDGASLLGTYWRIVFPLMRPILMTTVILGFQAAWNAFLTPYVLTLSDESQRTLVVGVYALRSTAEGTQAYDLMLSGAMVLIIPMVIVFILLQRYFIKGMTEGGLKG